MGEPPSKYYGYARKRLNRDTPAGLRRKAVTLAMALKAVKQDWHILHDTTTNEVPSFRLKFRQPYDRNTQEMLSGIPDDRSKDDLIATAWTQEWEESGPTRLHRQVSDPRECVKGKDLCRKHRTTLHRLRTGVDRLIRSSTAAHYIHCRPSSEVGLFQVGSLTRAYLLAN